MGMTPQHFHSIPTSCVIMPTMNITKLSTGTLPIHMHWMNKVLSIVHSTVFHWSVSAMFSSSKISQHNLNSNILYRPSTAHVLQSFCIQARQVGHICHAQYSNYIVHCRHPQHNSLAVHINMHHTPSTSHHTALHNPLHTTNKHKAHLSKWRQNGTRCKDGVQVLWCHSHLVWLVFESSIPTCACFHSENILWLVYVCML